MWSFLAPAAAAAVGGALSFLGTSSSNRANRAINEANNAFSAHQAQLNRDFQERMSGTAFQRGVADMRAAGINPMLAVSQGGASVPSGSSAQGIAQANQQNELAGLAASAKDAVLLAFTLRKMEAETEATQQQGKMYAHQANLNMANMNNAVVTNKLLEAEVPSARLKAQVDSSEYATLLELFKRLGLNVNSAVTLAKYMGKRRYSTTRRGTHYDSSTGVVLN